MKDVLDAKAYNDLLMKMQEAADLDARPLVPHDEVMRKATAIIEVVREHLAA